MDKIDLLEKILIAAIVSVEKHPNADRLKVLKLNLGENTTYDGLKDSNGYITVVTGAPNIDENSKNQKVAFLGPENIVPGFYFKNKEIVQLVSKELRGVMSHGMILSEREIGISEAHEGVLIVDKENVRVGENIFQVLTEDFIKSLDSYQILKGLESVTEEILGKEDLVSLLEAKKEINHYIGFEISGLIHLGTGLCTGLVIRELQKLGVKCNIFLADWHTWINNKFGGDREVINKVGKEYFEPGMRLSLELVGVDVSKVGFFYGTDIYEKNLDYMETMLDVSKNLTLSRVRKSTTIMGRNDSDSLPFAMLIYPPMQVADIFTLNVEIAHAGTDQRKAHVIAREVAKSTKKNKLKDVNGEKLKPISIHHKLLSGLNKPSVWPIPEGIDKKALISEFKMSKSVEGSAIFINDTEEEIRNAVNKAFCPEFEVEYNPVLSWIEIFILKIKNKFELKREEKYGGDKTYTDFEKIKADYKEGKIFPLDLKNSVAEFLVDFLKPAREYFSTEEMQEIIKEIKQKKTR